MKTRRAAEKERLSSTRNLRSSKSPSKSSEHTDKNRKAPKTAKETVKSKSKEPTKSILRKRKREGDKRVSFSENAEVAPDTSATRTSASASQPRDKKMKSSRTTSEVDDGERRLRSLRPRAGGKQNSRDVSTPDTGATGKTTRSTSSKTSSSNTSSSRGVFSKKGKSKGN